MASDKKPSSRTIIDVSSPDSSASDPSSRPLIVTNRPIMKDPMVVDDENKDSGEESNTDSKTKAELPEKSSKDRIEPFSAPVLPIETEDKSESNVKENISEPETSKEVDEDSIAKDETKEQTDNSEESPIKPEENKEQDKNNPETETEKEAALEEPIPKVDEPKEDAIDSGDKKESTAKNDQSVEQKETEELVRQAEREEALQKLTESKKYYLPINTIEKRRSKRFVILGILLSLLLIVAWLDIALDAGLISNSSNLPHTNFFAATAPAPTSSVAPASPTPAVALNTKVLLGSQLFIKAIQNKDKTAADLLESTSAKATFLASNGSASFYDTCQNVGQKCTVFFSSGFITKSVKTYKAYTAQDGAKGQTITYSVKTFSHSPNCTTSSINSLEMNLVPSGHNWLVDNITTSTSAGTSTGKCS